MHGKIGHNIVFAFDELLRIKIECPLGTILTAVFATTAVNPDGANGLIHGETELFVANMLGSVVVVVFTVVATFLIIKFVDLFMKVRVSDEEELEGLDKSQHGEAALRLK